jgi:hypothetical protein
MVISPVLKIKLKQVDAWKTTNNQFSNNKSLIIASLEM